VIYSAINEKLLMVLSVPKVFEFIGKSALSRYSAPPQGASVAWTNPNAVRYKTAHEKYENH
jgi:hypothetical protein